MNLLGLGGPRADLREVMNAILYINRTGVPLASLPHDFPPKSTVFAHFKVGTDGDVLEQLGVRCAASCASRSGANPSPRPAQLTPRASRPRTPYPPRPRAWTLERRSSGEREASLAMPGHTTRSSWPCVLFDACYAIRLMCC